MDPARRDQLSERYGFREWLGTRAPTKNIFIWGLAFGGNELPGWQLQRTQLIPGQVHAIHSVWLQKATRGPALLVVDAYECSSRAAAQEVLLDLLGDFQSPLVERLREPPAGELAFGPPGDALAVFVRGNVAVVVRNGEREIFPASKAAREVDNVLLTPHQAKADAAPEIRSFSPAFKEARVGEPVPLEIVAADPLGRPVWYRLEAVAGDFELVDERVAYVSTTAGTQTLAIVAVNANRGTASREVELQMR